VRRWTVDEFEAMIDAGIFHPDERLELIHGHLCTMSPQSDSHFDTVTLVAAALREQAPNTMHVREQGPLHLEDGSRPEPDVMLIPGTIQEYNGGRTNRPVLVVEVAASSLTYDRSTKADLYARHGLPEYWIVDLQHRTVEVYTDPGPDVYRTKRTAEPGDTITPGCAPDAALAVAALLPTPADVEHDVEDDAAEHDAPGHD
jgi:Uma2 family endonuclease